METAKEEAPCSTGGGSVSGKAMESTDTRQMPTGASDVGCRAAGFICPARFWPSFLAVHIPSWKGNIYSVVQHNKHI